VSDRTVRRWVSGEDQPKPGVYADLSEILRHHELALSRLHGPLRSAAGNST
jgi:hypothetical protein